MTKLYSVRVNHCWACPHCTKYDTDTMKCGCGAMDYREFDRSEVNPDTPEKYFPKWCPLPNMSDNSSGG